MEKAIIVFLLAISVAETYGVSHMTVGKTAQDEAIATAIDEGLTQDRYLALSYGSSAGQMLEEAYAARSEYYVEGANIIKHLSNGDIRNVIIGEPNPNGTTNRMSYLSLNRKMKNVFLKTGDPTPISGRMFGVTNAYEKLLAAFRARAGMPVKAKGDVSPYLEFDAQGASYSFWPLGCAIHSCDAYAEEVSHYFNSCDPRSKPVTYKGTWSSPDHERVSSWNELLAALRGLKVHAFASGINLNESNLTTQQVVDENFVTNTVVVAGTPRFDTYYQLVEPQIATWVENNYCPLPTNSYVLLLAYREAISHEGKETDNSAYRRLREICRNFKIAKLVL